MNPHGNARKGHTLGHVQIQLPDGFTKSTNVHRFGPDINTTVQLRELRPYQARYDGIDKG